MEATADHYATLGVEPRAEAAAIRVAYRNLMRRYHPDVNSSDEAALRATEINAAYACLSDPDERAFYDRLCEARKSRPAFAAAADPSSPPRHYQPVWHHAHTYAVDIEAEPAPRKWKILSLGLAAVVTLVTFKITSEINGLVMPAPEPMTFVHTAVPPPAVAPTANDPNCERAGRAPANPCAPPDRPAAR